MVWSVRKILVPTDGSPAAFNAVEVAENIAASHNAEIIGLFSYPPAGLQVEGAAALEDIEREIGSNALSQMEEFFAKTGRSFRKLLLRGSAVDAIVQTARSEEVDLIVMGSRGRTLARRLTGSVTSAVVAHAPCAVLSVPHKKI